MYLVFQFFGGFLYLFPCSSDFNILEKVIHPHVEEYDCSSSSFLFIYLFNLSGCVSH